jgi:hypothetical protein
VRPRHNVGATAAFHSTADQSVRIVVPQLCATSRLSLLARCYDNGFGRRFKSGTRNRLDLLLNASREVPAKPATGRRVGDENPYGGGRN